MTWTVDRWRGVSGQESPEHIIVRDERGRGVAEATHHYPEPIEAALERARLLAAAPALRDALAWIATQQSRSTPIGQRAREALALIAARPAAEEGTKP